MRRRLPLLAASFFLVTGLLVPCLSFAAPKKGSITPKQEVSIPFVKLSEPLKTTEGGIDYLYIPWMAEYMTGIYQAGVAFASFLAAIFIVIGGLRWAVAGGNSGAVTKGKKMIKNGLVGLTLSLGAYIVLYLINPSLVNFKSLKIRVVKSEALKLEILDKGVFEQLAAIGLKAKPQLAGLVCNPLKERDKDENDCYHGRPGTMPEVPMDNPKVQGSKEGDKDVLLPYVYAAGKKWGIDPCLAYATIGAESGWRPGAIAHDEDWPTAPWTVPARMRHLKACGINVTSKDGIPFQTLCNDDASNPECIAFEKATADKCKNMPSKPFKNKPPDYGFDWQYSHGFGLGQSTIFSSTKCPDGQRGITYEDRRPDGFATRCYTPPELLNPTTAIDAIYREIAGIQFADGSAKRSPESVLTTYICSNCESQAEDRISSYHACKANFQGLVCGITCNSSGCNASASRDICDNYEQMMKDWKPPTEKSE